MRSDIVPGNTFPDYQLPDHTGTPRKLSELQGDDPLILTLARGHYCPKEHQQHLELAAFYPRIAAAYTQIVTIATDLITTPLQELAHPRRRPVALSPPTQAASSRRTSTSRSTPTPTTTPWFRTPSCSNPASVIHSVYGLLLVLGTPLHRRPLARPPRRLRSEVRPDWDLSTPGPARRMGHRRSLTLPRLEQKLQGKPGPPQLTAGINTWLAQLHPSAARLDLVLQFEIEENVSEQPILTGMRPHLNLATICERYILEPDGGLTLFRIVDRFTVSGTASEMPVTQINFNLVKSILDLIT